jgi:hypothetical protein
MLPTQRLHDLGQSLWLDNITRRLLAGGTLAYPLHGVATGGRGLYVMINADTAPLTFRIQEGLPGVWRRAIDTAMESPGDIAEAGTEGVVAGLDYEVQPRTAVVLIREAQS